MLLGCEPSFGALKRNYVPFGALKRNYVPKSAEAQLRTSVIDFYFYPLALVFAFGD